MKSVVIDGYALNPGDLSWRDLEEFGECAVYDRTAPEQVLERAADAEAILTNKVVLSRELIAGLPWLKYIGVTATGYNIIDVEAARERGIRVTNVPGYSTKSVAQMVFALLLEMTQQVGHHARLVAEGRWSSSPDFCFWERPLVELDGLTMGVVGFGQIGQAVAKLARAFGMRVLVNTEHPERYREAAAGMDVRFADLETLFDHSDVISLHCPLTPATAGLVGAERLALMKPSAFLINTSRGPLIDETALAAALSEGRLAGAGEPPPADGPLQGAPNCFITPHIAWATRSARERLLATVVANIRAFVAGKPKNVVV
jgi:glycerate dehydrogenase